MSTNRASLANVSQIAGITTCRHCQKNFVGPAGMLITTDGRNADRVTQLVKALLEHLTKEHPNELMQANIAAMQFNSLQIMLNFSTTDQAFNEARNMLRWEVHQRTLSASFSDEALKKGAQAAALEIASRSQDAGPESEHHASLEALIAEVIERELRAVRNALQEPEPPKPAADPKQE